MAELSTQQDVLKILPKTICRTISSRFSEKILYCVTLIWVAVSIVAARARSHLSSSPPQAPFQSSHADCLNQHLICMAPIQATQQTITQVPSLVLESFTPFYVREVELSRESLGLQKLSIVCVSRKTLLVEMVASNASLSCLPSHYQQCQFDLGRKSRLSC